jgi:group II intron reverse transcriptase/maturase
MLERILSRENMTAALKRVKSNKGASGVDGMTVDELLPYLNESWAFIKAELLESTYKPSPVKKVEIPKPDGSKRMLGIPTVLDRLIQQAISQKLSELYDNGFSDRSYGFRPGRSAHQAVKQAKEYILAGNTVVIEFDLEKFFDKVNHDRLMTTLSRRIEDKRLLKLIRKYLESGIMANGKVSSRTEGTPQGSPLSPILSNIVLDELDKELEVRGHKFVRYADDLSIYVRSLKSAVRVKESISGFIECKLKLKVNQTKSKISTPQESNLLGFSFYQDKDGWQIRISDKSCKKFKKKVKQLTSRRQSISIEERLTSLKVYMTGWVNYFRIANCRNRLKDFDGWTRFRLRMCIWKTWKKIRTRIVNLTKLGFSKNEAIKSGNTRKSYCRIAHSPILTKTLTNKHFAELGYVSLESIYLKWQF